jgi:hypothetical protein
MGSAWSQVETCSVVGSDWCKSPPHVESPVAARAECFACGLRVCTSPSCSRIRSWYTYGRKRICKTCEVQDG